MAIYDVDLGGIPLPTMEQDFAEQIGADFELVGAAVMPGPPRPPAFYSMNIPIYGDPTETDPMLVGTTKRDQVVSLLQNDLARYEGYAFMVSFDTALNGYLVIGTAQIQYGMGGPSMGDYMLNIGSAALLPAQQVFLATRLISADLRQAAQPLDQQWQVYRQAPLKMAAVARHYLPVGAEDVLGQADPKLVPVQSYSTIFGDGVFAEDRLHGERLAYRLPFEHARKGDVRVFDRPGGDPKKWSAAGDLDPENHYGWWRVYGSNYPLGEHVPALDNGRARARVNGGKLAVDACTNGRYSEAATTVTLGYPTVSDSRVVELTTERAVLSLTLRGKNDLAVAFVTLQRGWPGPAIEIYRQAGSRHTPTIEGGEAHVEEIDHWTRIWVGVREDEAMIATRGVRLLGMT